MRILLISDIHANWPAVQMLNESFDVCLCLGDIVDYGVEPGPCIDWVRANATLTIRGNHDHGAAQGVVIHGGAGFRYLTGVSRPLTCSLINDEQRRWLASLPLTRYVTLNGKSYLMVHATPRDPMDEFAPNDVEFWQKRLEGIDVDYVLCGHTHQPCILHVGKTTIINPGSLGLPRDGDPRASYAIISDNTIELRRVDYPFQKTLDVLSTANLPDKAKQMLAEVYRTGKLTNGRNGHGKVPGP